MLILTTRKAKVRAAFAGSNPARSNSENSLRGASQRFEPCGSAGWLLLERIMPDLLDLLMDCLLVVSFGLLVLMMIVAIY